MNAILATTHDFMLALRGTMPWTLSDNFKDISKMDMSFFRKMTKGANLVMGYNTWLSLNEQTLPGRRLHIIITSKEIESTDKVKYVTLEEFKKTYMKMENLWCIGGAKLYSELIPHCEDIYWNELNLHKRNYNKLIGCSPKSERLFLDKTLKNFLQTRGGASYKEMETVLMSDGNQSFITYHHIRKNEYPELNICI